MINVTDRAWFNGDLVRREAAAPSVASISLHMGTGVFDGLMAYWNDDHFYLHKAREHLTRFIANATHMKLIFRWRVEDLEAGIALLLKESVGTTHYIRPIAFRTRPQLLLTGSEETPADVAIFGVPVDRDQDTGLRCQLSPIERVSSRAMPVKHKVCGVYANSYLVRRAAEELGCHDGIMLDRNGYVTEASAANVFFIDRSGIITPELTDDIFPGITRATILELARAAGLSTAEVPVRASDLAEFDAAFLCSTLSEVRPLSCLDGRPLQTPSNPIFREVIRKFRGLTRS